MTNRSMTAVVQNAVTTILKVHDYHGSSGIFLRHFPEVDHLVSLQKSGTSTSGCIRITVNLGVWVMALAPIRDGIPDKPDVWSAHWRQRLGGLMPGQQDTWWTATTDAEAMQVGREIADAIEQYGLPELDGFRTPESLIELWSHGRGPGLTDGQRQRLFTALQAELSDTTRLRLSGTAVSSDRARVHGRPNNLKSKER
jgi:hypothetical protein